MGRCLSGLSCGARVNECYQWASVLRPSPCRLDPRSRPSGNGRPSAGWPTDPTFGRDLDPIGPSHRLQPVGPLGAVVGLGGDPQYARNDGGAATLDFGPQAWAGAFRNSGAPTPNVPLFPQGGDVVAGGALASVIADPTIGGYGGLAGTVARYAPDIGSPVLGAIDWRPDSVVDLRGIVRAPAASFGAIEEP